MMDPFLSKLTQFEKTVSLRNTFNNGPIRETFNNGSALHLKRNHKSNREKSNLSVKKF